MFMYEVDEKFSKGLNQVKARKGTQYEASHYRHPGNVYQRRAYYRKLQQGPEWSSGVVQGGR